MARKKMTDRKPPRKTLTISNEKTGEAIHSIRGLAASEAKVVRRYFYRVLVKKLRVKAAFSIA
jgi:hypothetical protein